MDMRLPPLRVVVLLLPALIEFVTALDPLCDNDTDCEDGFTCQEHNCRDCVNCSVLFRTGNICVTDFKDCGDCMEGYKEIILTHFSVVAKPCTPAKQEVTLTNCTSDYNCPSNSYCNEGLCVECFDCNLINRLQSVGNCTKSQEKCGPCFTGFLEVYAEDQSNFTCEENVCALCKTYKQFGKELSSNFTFLYISAVIILIVLMVCLCRSYETASTSNPVIPSASSTINKKKAMDNHGEKSSAVLNFESQNLQQPNAQSTVKTNSQKENDCGMTTTDSLLPSGDNEKVSANLNFPPISLTWSCEGASGRQSVDVITSSDNSSGHKPALDTQDSAHVTVGTRISAKEGTDDFPRNQNQEDG